MLSVGLSGPIGMNIGIDLEITTSDIFIELSDIGLTTSAYE